MRREWMTPILAGLSALIGGCAMAAHTLEAGALPPGAGYVAMGSSYASGPGVATWSGDGPPACARSVQSYSRQLARLRGLTLTDRSCSGAITPHILVGGQAGQPPQLDGLSADIRLVTVTIGGNDVRYTADSNQWTCLNLPSAQRAAPCPTGAPLDAEPAFKTLDANLRAIVAEVKRRSPRARLIFVDYITLMPPPGVACAKLPLTPAQIDELRARAERLVALTAQVARETGVEVLKASELTRDHHACAADPWGEGYAVKKDPADFGPAAFHPKEAAHTAIAKALDAMLR